MSYVQPAIVIEGRSQIAVSAGGQTDPLASGTYDVWADADTYIKVGKTASDVTTGTGYKIPAGAIVPVRIGRDGLRIGSTGALSVHRVE